MQRPTGKLLAAAILVNASWTRALTGIVRRIVSGFSAACSGGTRPGGLPLVSAYAWTRAGGFFGRGVFMWCIVHQCAPTVMFFRARAVQQRPSGIAATLPSCTPAPRRAKGQGSVSGCPRTSTRPGIGHGTRKGDMGVYPHTPKKNGL